MKLREKCPYYWYSLDGKNVCTAPRTLNASVDGSRLPDCEYQEFTDTHCNAQPGTLITFIHLIPLSETVFTVPEVCVFKHEVNGNHRT